MKTNTKRLVISSMLLAAAYLLPFLTGQIKQFGAALTPMHIPVLLCGFICGWQWGLAVGVIAPLLRSVTLGMPVIFPSAVCMSVELAVYGAVAGLMYKFLPKKKPFIYVALLTAMVAGRALWGIAQLICLGFDTTKFTLTAVFTRSVLESIPGIILQIVLVPLIVMLTGKWKVKI